MLQDILTQLHDSDEYPLHMPGHKRQSIDSPLDTAYGLDITEIIGYDNLYDAQDVLKEAMEYAGELYGCPCTFYLLNGATGGIHIAVQTAASMYEEAHPGKKGRLLIASNCHRSVRAAGELSGLTVDVTEPGTVEGLGIYGAVLPADIEEKLLRAKEENAPYAALVITSPTYEGIISDIEVIADICHRYDTILITDEAHGAHLDLTDGYPNGALKYGSDIVIHSTHKTLAAMTQTALLHVQGNLVDITKIRKYWTYLQTSSPSYVLMASIDAALHHVAGHPDLVCKHLTLVEDLREKLAGLKNLHIMVPADLEKNSEIVALDPCKAVIFIRGSYIDGQTVQQILLKDYHIQTEYATKEYVLGIITYMDTVDGLCRFTDAILEIDDRISQRYYNDIEGVHPPKGELYAPCIPENRHG